MKGSIAMRFAFVIAFAISLIGCRTLSSTLSEDFESISPDELADQFVGLFRMALATKDYNEYLYNFDTEKFIPVDNSRELESKADKLDKFSTTLESVDSHDFVMALQEKLTPAEKLEFFRMVRSSDYMSYEMTSFYSMLASVMREFDV